MDRQKRITENFNAVKSKIAQACLKADRNPEDVALMAVTKYACDEDITALLENTNINFIGESRLQDYEKRWTADGKLARFAPKLTKCFIGSLQRNKAKKTASLFDITASLDSEKLALFLNEKAAELGKVLPVLIQVKLSDRDTQGGIETNQASALVNAVRKLPNLAPCGYMAIAPLAEDKEQLRPLFRKVKVLYDRDFPKSGENKQRFYLSLGMSDDFDIAVEEGSTLPRIGSALFKN